MNKQYKEIPAPGPVTNSVSNPVKVSGYEECVNSELPPRKDVNPNGIPSSATYQPKGNQE